MVLEGLQKLLFVSKSPASKKISLWLDQISTELPKNPNFLMRVLQMSYGIETDKEKLAREIVKDKKLVARLLKVSEDLNDLNQINHDDFVKAFETLELPFIQNTIELEIAKKYISVLSAQVNEDKLHELLRATTRSTVVAKAISKWYGYKQPEMVFMTALLTKLPQIIMAIKDPRAYERTLELVEQGSDLEQAQIIAYGFDQWQFAIEMSKRYALPNIMQEYFNKKSLVKDLRSKSKQLAMILNFAEYINNAFADKTQNPSGMWTAAQEHIHGLGLDFDKNSWADKISVLFVKTIDFEMTVVQ